MKRELDLARQLLLDIENRGTDCSVSVLRTGSNHETEEQIRYHLRLLIDAGLLKEIDRTSAGIPCVRLTHDGHELLELSRSETRWRDAKSACQERSGGLSLTVIRGLLLSWAMAAPPRQQRYFRVPAIRRLRYESEFPRERAAYRVEPYPAAERLIDRDSWEDGISRYERRHDEPRYEEARYDNVRYVDIRPETNGHAYRGRHASNGVDRYGVDLDGDGRVDVEFESPLPGYLI